MNLYLIANPNGEWFAADGEGYTSLLRHAAVFLSEKAAQLIAADAPDACDVVVTKTAAMLFDMSPKSYALDAETLARCVWNTALLCEARYSGTEHENDLWIAEGA